MQDLDLAAVRSSYMQQSWIEHLSALRRRLIYILVTFIVLFAASLIFVNRIYNYLVRPVNQAHLHLVVTSPGEVITIYMMVGGFVAIGLTLPFALYHIWRFVSPGLTARERRYTLRLLPLTLIMFVVGVAFAWFIIFPHIFHFLMVLSEQHFTPMIRANSYFSFMTNICLPFGFIFELPIVVVFLTRIGVIGPRFLRKVRRYAYLVIIILGVLISPPELVSHLSVVVPMMLLYEISIGLSVVAVRRREKARAAAEKALS